GLRRTSMLTRWCSESVESSLQEMPGATSSHSGSSTCGAGPNDPAEAESVSRRATSRSHSDGAGRKTSVGQASNEPTRRRSDSNSCLQAAHTARCASTAEASLADRAPIEKAYTSSV